MNILDLPNTNSKFQIVITFEVFGIFSLFPFFCATKNNTQVINFATIKMFQEFFVFKSVFLNIILLVSELRRKWCMNYNFGMPLLTT